MWQIKEKGGVKYFETVFKNIRIIFTSRRGGNSVGQYQSLNLSYDVGDKKETVDQNYEKLRKVLGIERIFTLTQIHSTRIVVVNREQAVERNNSSLKEGDGLITEEKGLYLGIKVADCLPVAFFNRLGSQVGICHIGWRGALANLAEKMAEQFRKGEIFYSLLPSISGRCYEVGEDVFRSFKERYPKSFKEFFTLRGGSYLLDLRRFVSLTLKEVGLKEYPTLEYCSHCEEELFYSKRRDGITGRNLALIGLLA